MQHDIFISYSRRNHVTVNSIKEELDALGFSCWMDLEGIVSGTRQFSQRIIDAIDDAKCMLFFLSTDSQALVAVPFGRMHRERLWDESQSG